LISAKLGWAIESLLDKVCQIVINNGFHVLKYWDSPVQIGTVKVFIGYVYEGEWIRIFFVFIDNSTKKIEKDICKIWPNQDYLGRFYGHFHKRSNNELEIQSANKEFKLLYDVLDDCVKVEGTLPRWIQVLAKGCD
jgi:hypothetical protein